MNCQPRNRLLLRRTRGFAGPFFQNVGSYCIKGQGNAFAPGGALAGAKPINGIVDSETQITLTFSQCIEDKTTPCAHPKKVTVTADGALQNVTNVVVSDITMTITVSTIQAGDEVKVSYDDTDGCFVECADGDPVAGFTDYPVNNPLVIEGDFILMETGGSDIILTEDDIDGSSGVQTEEAS